MPALFLCLFTKRVLGLVCHAVMLQFICKRKWDGRCHLWKNVVTIHLLFFSYAMGGNLAWRKKCGKYSFSHCHIYWSTVKNVARKWRFLVQNNLESMHSGNIYIIGWFISVLIVMLHGMQRFFPAFIHNR